MFAILLNGKEWSGGGGVADISKRGISMKQICPNSLKALPSEICNGSNRDLCTANTVKLKTTLLVTEHRLLFTEPLFAKSVQKLI